MMTVNSLDQPGSARRTAWGRMMKAIARPSLMPMARAAFICPSGTERIAPRRIWDW